MIKALQLIHPLLLLIVATTLEASGDAIVRMAMYNHAGVISLRVVSRGRGSALRISGSFLNLAPIQFGRVVGLYIATLFVVWQVINYIAFKSLPTVPILAGGALTKSSPAVGHHHLLEARLEPLSLPASGPQALASRASLWVCFYLCVLIIAAVSIMA